MVKVQKNDTPTAKLYWGTLLLSWIPFIGLGLAINGIIRSAARIITSRKAHKLDKRALVGASLSFIALLVGYSTVYASLNPTPIIALSTSGSISTDNANYELIGIVSNISGGELVINGETVSMNGDNFSHKVELKEGDNPFKVVATNKNGTDEDTVKIYRTTAAELKARKDAAIAEEARKAKDAAGIKAAAEAKATAEAAAAARRVQDLKSCSIDITQWTESEQTAYPDDYGNCGGFDVINPCDEWFHKRYPYKGSKMHYIMDLREQGKMPDGSKYIIVGVTVENAFGAKYEATLKCAGKYAGGGLVSNTVFNVY